MHSRHTIKYPSINLKDPPSNTHTYKMNMYSDWGKRCVSLPWPLTTRACPELLEIPLANFLRDYFVCKNVCYEVFNVAWGGGATSCILSGNMCHSKGSYFLNPVVLNGVLNLIQLSRTELNSGSRQ